MATDPDLIADASMRIQAHGLTPERAIWEAIGSVADTIRGVGSRQAERVVDLYDIRNRMVSSLTGRSVPAVADPGQPFVLLAVELAPADAAGLDPARCLAIVTEEGGPTSHTAIIARSLGIPAVVAARGATKIADGTLLLVDGSTGELIKEPTSDQRATAAVYPTHRAALAGPGSTADGQPGRSAGKRRIRERRNDGPRVWRRGSRAIPDRALLPGQGRRALGFRAGQPLSIRVLSVRRPPCGGAHP